MSNKLTLKAEKREILGRKVKKLRKEGLTPANVFGPKVKSVSVTVKTDDFLKTYKEAGESSIIELSIAGEKEIRPILVRQVQTDPISRKLLHIDLRQVNLKEKITALIDLENTGEAPAASKGALIINLKDQVEVEALPTDLPEKITVDISKLNEIGDVITVADLVVDTVKVKILDEVSEVLVKAEAPAAEEVAPEPVEAETKEGEVKEGEQKAEDKKPADAKPEADKKSGEKAKE